MKRTRPGLSGYFCRRPLHVRLRLRVQTRNLNLQTGLGNRFLRQRQALLVTLKLFMRVSVLFLGFDLDHKWTCSRVLPWGPWVCWKGGIVWRCFTDSGVLDIDGRI